MKIYVRAPMGHVELVEVRSREYQCGDKKQYRKKKAALLAAGKYEQEFARPMNIYVCPWCEHYHIGGKEKDVIPSQGTREGHPGV